MISPKSVQKFMEILKRENKLKYCMLMYDGQMLASSTSSYGKDLNTIGALVNSILSSYKSNTTSSSTSSSTSSV
ncbi:hypothetical protein MP638_006367 [Amoeboaphelidium occidentale]|nr:hypothetical protein MP638_006367 [Amoeboaphelidium occidentale]